MSLKLKPLADRLLVKPLEEEEVTPGGIVLPETAKEKPQKGEVLAVGPGARDDEGNRIAMDVSVGDKVLFAKYGGTEIKMDGDKLLILRESDILAILVSSRSAISVASLDIPASFTSASSLLTSARLSSSSPSSFFMTSNCFLRSSLLSASSMPVLALCDMSESNLLFFSSSSRSGRSALSLSSTSTSSRILRLPCS